MANTRQEEEADQEAALQTYKNQLAQVEMTMTLIETEEEKAPLLQLTADLKELIQISEEALLQLKKENLMKQICGEDDVEALLDESQNQSLTAAEVEPGCSSSKTSQNSGQSKPPIESASNILFTSTSSENQQTDSSSLEQLYSGFDYLLGTFCRAPNPRKGGHHNAIVHSLEGIDEQGEVEVKVIYTHPQEQKMITCPFFLDGKCKFDDNCRKSHGVVVKVTDLQDFIEPDFTELQVGSLCLAKQTEGNNLVWLPAEILHLEEGLVTVQMKSVNQTLALPFDDIFPLGDDDNDTSSDDDDDEEDDRPIKLTFDDDDEEEDVVREIKINDDLSEFGLWEKNTRGIGMKLLSKWGYVMGSGLGKDGEGRVVPVETKITPQGKSLDVCMAMRLKRENGSIDPILVKKRKKRKTDKKDVVVKKGYVRKSKEEESMSAFNFINSIKLTKKGGTTVVDDEGAANGNQAKQKTTEKTAEKSNHGLRVQLLQTEGEIGKVEKEMEKAQEIFTRNEKKNPAVASQATDKIKELEKYKNKLKHSLKSIQSEEKHRNTKQKLSIF